MGNTQSWSLLSVGASALIAILTLGIAVRYLKQARGDRHRQLIVVGGFIAGVGGIASTAFQIIAALDLFDAVSGSGDISSLMTAWIIVGLAEGTGQLLFLTGLYLAASRMSNERQRIQELEAIIRDRDGEGRGAR